MELSIWNFKEYKIFLRAWISAQPHRGHGSKAALARAAQCQTAYISQVVLGTAHLSLEQGERIAVFCGLSEEEKTYFLFVLQKDRAGTDALKIFFTKQMNALVQKRMQFKNRLETKSELTVEAQATYFSNWIYPAIHLLTRVPKFEKTEAISKRLKLPLSVVEEALRFLESVGVLSKMGGKYVAGNSQMHLPHDSALILKHHMNWRLRTMLDLEMRRDESLHYSSIITISEKDVTIIRQVLMKAIEEVKLTIKNSKDESLFSFCLDFFEV